MSVVDRVNQLFVTDRAKRTHCFSEVYFSCSFSLPSPPTPKQQLLASHEHGTDLAPKRQLATCPVCHMSHLPTSGVLPLDWQLTGWLWSSLRKRRSGKICSALFMRPNLHLGFSLQDSVYHLPIWKCTWNHGKRAG
jgi:hypothetical protein